MPVSPKVARARAHLAGHIKGHHPPEVVEAARRDLNQANAEEAIRKIIDAWPPLTQAQLNKLARLLRRPRGDAA